MPAIREPIEKAPEAFVTTLPALTVVVPMRVYAVTTTLARAAPPAAFVTVPAIRDAGSSAKLMPETVAPPATAMEVASLKTAAEQPTHFESGQASATKFPPESPPA